MLCENTCLGRLCCKLGATRGGGDDRLLRRGELDAAGQIRIDELLGLAVSVLCDLAGRPLSRGIDFGAGFAGPGTEKLEEPVDLSG